MRQLAFTLRRVDKNGQHRGGKRRGAGRKPCLLANGKQRHSHSVRPELDGKNHPVHVTMRVSSTLGSLRRRDLYHCIRWAVSRVTGRPDFRLVHVSIQRDHLHLLVETANRATLTSGMRSFAISAAHHLNRRMSRTGQVFVDRYHATPIKSPTQARNALAYVLNNWRKHGEDRGRSWRVDPFSSGIAFGGWKELGDSPFLYKPPASYLNMTTAFPKTWLLRTGWRRAGTISVHERPSSR